MYAGYPPFQHKSAGGRANSYMYNLCCNVYGGLLVKKIFSFLVFVYIFMKNVLHMKLLINRNIILGQQKLRARQG